MLSSEIGIQRYVELDELFALMGRDYADHLVLKLKRILDGIESRGVESRTPLPLGPGPGRNFVS